MSRNDEIIRDAVRRYPELSEIITQGHNTLSNIDDHYELIDIYEVHGKFHYNAVHSDDDMWDWKLDNMFYRTIENIQNTSNAVWIEQGKFTQERQEFADYLHDNRQERQVLLDAALRCYPELQSLLEEADERLINVDSDYILHQIKEKYGTLRYYASPGEPSRWDDTFAEKNEKFEEIIEDIEDRGTQIWMDSGFYYECYPNNLGKK